MKTKLKIFIKKHYKTNLLFLIGVGIGITITNLLIQDLKTPAYNYVGTDQDVMLTNNLGLASFDGSWIVISGEKIMNDVNAVAIDCWLNRKICDVAQANVYDGMLTNGITYYDITEWSSSGQITAISNSLCKDQVLKADIKTKAVTLTETKKDNSNSEICAKSSQPIFLKLGSRG